MYFRPINDEILTEFISFYLTHSSIIKAPILLLCELHIIDDPFVDHSIFMLKVELCA